MSKRSLQSLVVVLLAVALTEGALLYIVETRLGECQARVVGRD